MFSKKEKPKRNHAGKSLSQYGLFEVPADFDTGLGNGDDDEDDEDLEAELAALAGGGGSSKPKRPARRVIPQRELDSMVSESMKDEDDDESVDENDPELLSELNDIVGGDEPGEDSSPSQDVSSGAGSSDVVNTLAERLKNYEICEVKAKESGETTKARRYGRAVKTLKDLIKHAKSGSPIDLNDDSVPPDIHPSTAAPARPAPAIPPRSTPPEPLTPDSPKSATPDSPKEPPTEELISTEPEAPTYDQDKLNTLLQGQKQYKIAALKAKHEGNAQKAVLFLKVSKQFDVVIAALKSGQPVDLSDMPGPPETFSLPEPATQESEVQQNSPASAEEEPAEAAPALITASSVMEALQQRLGIYKEQEAKANEENNTSKARRYGRIIKQFEQAIKANKAGKPFAYEELPTPPGYGPIPGLQPPAPEPAAPAPQPKQPSRPVPQTTNSGENKSSPPSSGSKPGRSVGKQTQAEKQMLILIAKQKQFKLAALEAKKRGEMAQAKEFLRQSKGFDKLIEASIAGLPVDWSSIPVSPEAKSQLDNEYDIAMSTDTDDSAGIDSDLFARLETQLQKQLKMCLTTRDHNKAIGDVPGMNRFERFALNVTKDMDVVRAARKEGRIPKFHYETKEFAIVKCCPEIEDNTMEVSVHRGLNISADKDIDTYVKMEFPFPQETPYSDRTSTFKNTNNPDYEKTFVVPIQRNSRVCQRTFKRHSLKFELFSKGCACCGSPVTCPGCCSFLGGLPCFFGFFRSDSLIGTVNLKLQPLETQCEIHDTFDLLEGRKKTGGKLEIQVKLRTPIQTQQVEQIQERWLVVDQ